MQCIVAEGSKHTMLISSMSPMNSTKTVTDTLTGEPKARRNITCYGNLDRRKETE